MKVMADTVNGVYVVTSFQDFSGCEVLDENLFYSRLKNLGEGETIGAKLSDAMAAKIYAEYGICGYKNPSAV